jgi:hypothetical protein
VLESFVERLLVYLGGLGREGQENWNEYRVKDFNTIDTPKKILIPLLTPHTDF